MTVISHILFNEIFDAANIICMKIRWSILDVMRMRNYKGTSIDINRTPVSKTRPLSLRPKLLSVDT